MTDILSKLREIREDLEDVGSDSIPGLKATIFNRALNKLTNLIVEGEMVLNDKLKAGLATVKQSEDPTICGSHGFLDGK